jgi:predicted DCC family thiol-disulfide oxidoreductase YuxK
LHVRYFQYFLKTKKGTAMKAPEQIKSIEVFYDGRCGMCCTFHEWINKQPREFGIDFIPYQSPRAERVFPGIGTLDPAREMIVRTDRGEIFRGAEAWVMCLFSCANHQATARKLAGPYLLPVAIRACRILAANRHSLSKVFFHSKDKAVRETLHRMETPACETGFCPTK